MSKKRFKKDNFNITQYIRVSDKNTGAFIECIPSKKFEINATIYYESSVIGKQKGELTDRTKFESEISNAKTFFLIKTIKDLKEIKNIKGGSLKNAIVFIEKSISIKELKKLKINRKELQKGILNPEIMTFSDEAVRHKILDIIGDLSLLRKNINNV